MSLLPFLIELERPRRLRDQNFGLSLTPEDVLTLLSPGEYQRNQDYYRPWKQLSNLMRDSGSTIKSDKNKFQINLDVQHFSPEEVSVKMADGFLIVEGCHEEKRDEHGWVSRQFKRKYSLPDDCNVDAVESRLSSDGVLTVSVPLAPKVANERIVPIIQTGPVRTQPENSMPQSGQGEAKDSKPAQNGQ